MRHGWLRDMSEGQTVGTALGGSGAAQGLLGARLVAAARAAAAMHLAQSVRWPELREGAADAPTAPAGLSGAGSGLGS